MTAAPLHFEPTDPDDLPLIAVPADQWERIAGTIGARVELDPAGGGDVVIYNGYCYVAVSS